MRFETTYQDIVGERMTAADRRRLHEKMLQFQRDVELTMWADVALYECEPKEQPHAPLPKRGIRLTGALK